MEAAVVGKPETVTTGTQLLMTSLQWIWNYFYPLHSCIYCSFLICVVFLILMRKRYKEFMHFLSCFR